MGADGVFFRFAGRLHPRWRTPNAALLMLAGWAAVLALSGTFDQLLNYSTTGDWLGYAAVVATLFWYRRSGAAAPPFRVPLHPLLPATFVAAVLIVVATTAWRNPGDAGIGALIVLAGLPVYLIWRRLPPR
ncbi:MAG TPA: amino acid permease, partial [Dokdonella sp.]